MAILDISNVSKSFGEVVDEADLKAQVELK